MKNNLKNTVVPMVNIVKTNGCKKGQSDDRPPYLLTH